MSSMLTMILIDGFPRNAENMEAFERVTSNLQYKVVHFDCPEDTCRDRLLARGRHDDEYSTIMHRFDIYKKDTLPILSQLNPIHIDADGDPEQVFIRFTDALHL